MGYITIRLRLFGIAAALALCAGFLIARPQPASASSLCGTPGYGQGATPVVDSVSPNRGTFEGNNSVTLTGCGFTPQPAPGGQTTVLFGSTASKSVVVNSDTQVTAIAPPHGLGTVDVRVVTGYGDSQVQPSDQYTYLGLFNQCGAATLTASPPYQATAGTPVTFTATASGCWNPSPLYEFFILNAGSAAWTTVQAYSTSNVFVLNTSRLVLTPSIFAVAVKDASSTTQTWDSIAELGYSLNISSCSQVTVVASPASPQRTGTQVTFTATAGTCVNPNPQFEFLVRPVTSGTWTQEQGYSTNNVFNWDTTGLSGSYSVAVWLRDAASAQQYSVATVVTYVVQPIACSGVTLSAAPTSPQDPGAQVTLTAGAANCANSDPQYVFWVRSASSSNWILLSPGLPGPGPDVPIFPVYRAANTVVWDTSRAAGQYYLKVWAKDASSTTTSYDAVATIPYTVTVVACTAPTLSVASVSPGATGETAIMTAGSSSCANPEYRFWIKDPGRSWSMVKDYGPQNTHTWAQTYQPGVYEMEVDVREVGETVAYDAVKNITYTLNGCTGATLSASPTTAAHGAGPITLTATATCPGTPTYRFWVEDPGSRWSMVQDFSTSATYTWPKANQPAAGVYHIEVDVRDQGSQAVYEYATSGYTYTMS